MEERDPSYTAGGNVNWCNHYGKQYKVSSKHEKNVAVKTLPYYAEIALLGLYPDKTVI